MLITDIPRYDIHGLTYIFSKKAKNEYNKGKSYFYALLDLK